MSSIVEKVTDAVNDVTAALGNTSISEKAAETTTGEKASNTTTDKEAVLASAAEGRRLYIGNLAYATTEGELQAFFKGYLMYVLLLITFYISSSASSLFSSKKIFASSNLQIIGSREYLCAFHICAVCTTSNTYANIFTTVNPPLSQRTHVLTAQSDMLSSTFLPQLRPSVLSLSSLERRSLSARSLSNLLASQRQMTRLRLL